MPIVTGNSIEIEIREQVDQAIANNQKFLKEMDKNKAQFKEQQKAMDDAARASQSAAKTSTMSWTEFRSMYSTVLDVVRVGQAVWAETGGKFVENAVAVGDMARMMGVGTEEASRLKEIADDTGISFNSLASSLKLAAKDGVEPNIESLAKLSDEYLALAPGVERTQFLLDKFGKSGTEMGKLLEKGGASIREMSAGIDENHIVTQAAYLEARKYQIAVDDMSDSWDGFTKELGKSALPKMIGVMGEMNRNIEESGFAVGVLRFGFDDLFRGLFGGKKNIDELTEAQIAAEDAAKDAGGEFVSEAEAAKILADEAKAAEDAIKNITKANEEYLSMVGSISDRIETHRQKEAELQAQIKEAVEERKALISQGYSEEGKNIQDVDEKIDGLKLKWQELAAQQEEASRRMILNMLQQQLSVDGLSVAESNYLLETGLKWGIYSEEAVQAAKDAQAEVAKLTADLNSIPAEKSVTINTIFQKFGDLDYEKPADWYANGHAAGGSFMVPQSYGNEGFKMGNRDTASGGELITITPKSAVNQGAGGGSVSIDEVSLDKLARRLETAMQRLVI